jgi:ArsR family transcriptional regulator
MMPELAIDIETLKSSAQEACQLMKVLANQDRLLLLCQISQGEKCVSDLEEALDIHQPTLSQQLTVLRDEGLVTTRREGKYIYYSIANPAVMEVLEVLYRNFCS